MRGLRISTSLRSVWTIPVPSQASAVNVNGCRFNGRSRILFNSCDTPAITNSQFDETEGGFGAFPNPAIYLYGSPLAEAKNNVIRGRYVGINGTAQSESVVVGCTIEKCSTGLYWHGTNGMLKDLTIRECADGISTNIMSGSLENITIEKCKIGYSHVSATVQATNLVIKDVPKDGKAVHYTSGRPGISELPDQARRCDHARREGPGGAEAGLRPR